MSIFEKASRAGRVIASFLTDRAGRLKYAQRNRRMILKNQKEGLPFASPRRDWIRNQATQIVDQLRSAAATYDATYAWDIITPEDMRDALHTAAHTILADDEDEGDDEQD